MYINKISSPSFKAYVPVVYMAKSPYNDEFLPVLKKENLRKCHGYLVRNLNGTAKQNKNPELVNFYKKHDKDYAKMPFVSSVYSESGPVVFMVTGEDTNELKQYAKPIGRAKRESLENLGHSNSFESKLAVKNYFESAKYFLNHNCKQIKSNDDNSKLKMYAYFEPIYTKKEKKLKGFEFIDAKFVKED